MNESSKYNLYQLTYPYEGSTIYRSKSFKKAVKKCYKDFKDLNDMKEGIFSVTDIDKNVEYQFKVKNNKLYKMEELNSSINNQEGGGINNIDYTNQKLKDLIENNLDPLNQKIYKVEQIIDQLLKNKNEELSNERKKRLSLEDDYKRIDSQLREQDNIRFSKDNIYNERLLEINKKEAEITKKEVDVNNKLLLLDKIKPEIIPQSDYKDKDLQDNNIKDYDNYNEKNNYETSSDIIPKRNINKKISNDNTLEEKANKVYNITLERKQEYDKINNLMKNNSNSGSCIII
jgi:hypothetical protein